MAFRDTQTDIFRTRPALTTDAQTMALVLERACARRDGIQIPDTLVDSEQACKIGDRLDRPRSWAYIASGYDRMAGFVLGYASTEEQTIESDPTVEYLALLMVEPRYWGQDVGSLLLNAAAATARSIDMERMVLWTEESNLRARELYERHDYHLTDKTFTSSRQTRLVQYQLHL